jgi:uncharacterized membrane protein
MAKHPDPAQPTPYFDRLCIFVLSFEWIFFGSMHFSFHDATVQQIPEFIPFKSTLVVVTGMLEVATGILILVPNLRKWAAISSLVLLALLLPAVYSILANDSALQGPPAWRMLFRLLLLPNNIFLALCSVHLLQHPLTTPIEAGRIFDEMLARRRPVSHQGATLLVAFLLLAANCAGFIAILASSVRDHTTAYLWAMMCISVGAFIGFLFAVPRVNPTAPKSASLLPNTNIETVSDWLTKILVGVGLINLKEIGAFLNTTSDELAGAIGGPPPFAKALILYFFVIGLIQGYLLTRMFLAWQFALQSENPGTGKGMAR